MKPISGNNQLGLASPLIAVIQSGKNKILSKKEVGLDASHRTRVYGEEVEKCFFLTSSLIG
jgi:hypothetical protein